jgi:hypothetical protein
MSLAAKTYFYDAASPEASRDTRVFKPAVAFELKTGISGIAGLYKFPGDETPTAYEERIATKFSHAVFSAYEDPVKNGFRLIPASPVDPFIVMGLKKEWDGLVALKPALETVKVPQEFLPAMLFDALNGANCLLNPGDIHFFLQEKANNRRFDLPRLVRERLDHAALIADVEKMAGHPVRWIASPQTLQSIRQKLASRHA